MALSLNNGSALLCNSTTISGYPFTLVGRFRVPNVNAQMSLLGLISFSTGARCDVFYAGNTTDAAVAQTQLGSSIGAASSAISMTPGTWHHVMAVFASSTSRKIYLDGGNLGTNTDSVTATSLDFFYLGNILDSNQVEIADVAIVSAEASAEHAASLAAGCPIMSTSLAGQTVAYHDCIRQQNHPGVGPSFTSGGSPVVVDHPRAFFATSGNFSAMPLRYQGPWHAEQAEMSSLSAETGQLTTAGIELNNSILSAEVMS